MNYLIYVQWSDGYFGVYLNNREVAGARNYVDADVAAAQIENQLN